VAAGYGYSRTTVAMRTLSGGRKRRKRRRRSGAYMLWLFAAAFAGFVVGMAILTRI